MKIILRTLALAVSAAVSVLAADPVVHRDLAYAEPRNPQQTLDVYSPASGTGHPIVVWIHGGGWAHGDKSDLQAGAHDPVNRKPHAFVEKGYVFVAINYRLFPEADIRQMGTDAAHAIRWVHDHAADYGGDSNTIFVMGHSAGSQLAALVCTDGSYLAEAGLSLRAIKGCVPVDGDMYYPPLRLSTEESIREAVSDRLKFPNDGAQKEYSAVMHVGQGKGIPAFLILHVAGHPETGTMLQSQIFGEVLREAGVPVEVLPCEGKVHATLNSDLGLPDDKPTEAVFAFLNRQLSASPAVAAADPQDSVAPDPLSPAGAEPFLYGDIAYAQPRSASRSLDVYAPADGENHPVVIWVHGGGWQHGDKAALQIGSRDPVNRKPRLFVSKGYVFVSINYRFVPEVTITTMMGDVAKAVAWVHSNIRAYRGDPNRIFIMGHSAGAQLVALLCTDRGYLKEEGLDISDIKGCVPVDGDTYYPELETDIEPNIATANAQLLDFPDLATQQSLSSVLHTFKGKPIPPFLLLCIANHPRTHSKMQTYILAEALREAAVPVTVVACPNRVHETLNSEIGTPGDLATSAILEFLDAQLKKSP